MLGRIDHPGLLAFWQQSPHGQSASPLLLHHVWTKDVEGILVAPFEERIDRMQGDLGLHGTDFRFWGGLLCGRRESHARVSGDSGVGEPHDTTRAPWHDNNGR